MAPRRVAYALQEPLKKELEDYKKQQILVSLGMDETAKCHYSFVFLLKANGKVFLCLALARLNKALIRPVHRGSTLNDILLRLSCIEYLTLINESPGYHNFKLEKSITFYHIFLSIWQVQTHRIAAQSSPSRK